MAQNIEIKARVRNRDKLLALVKAIADSGPVEIRQDDTFFHCPNGRLKLRQMTPTCGQLIYYDRTDINGPKTSTYSISETTEPEQLRKTLESALGVTGHIRKRRLLYMYGDTRIHIDDVEGLGNFVELEVVLDDPATAEAGQRIVEKLMVQLEIKENDLLAVAYVDMASVSFP